MRTMLLVLEGAEGACARAACVHHPWCNLAFNYSADAVRIT